MASSSTPLFLPPARKSHALPLTGEAELFWIFSYSSKGLFSLSEDAAQGWRQNFSVCLRLLSRGRGLLFFDERRAEERLQMLFLETKIN